MPDETISPYGRGDCSVCGREMNLLKSGRVRHHGGERGGGLWPSQRTYRCTGSGEPPTCAGAQLAVSDVQ